MIYFLGDVHGRFDHILPAILADDDHASRSVVFLGDMDCNKPFEQLIEPLLKADIDVWFIHGNHDTDYPHNWAHLADSAHRNLDGRVCEIEGLRIAGLGGVFRGKIWYPRDQNHHKQPLPSGDYDYDDYDDYLAQLTRRTPRRERDTVKSTKRALKHRSSIFPNVYEQLAQQQADILVTHEAPSCHPNGFAVLDHLAQRLGVNKVFHGHHHDNLDYQEANARLGFQTHGVGLRGITDQTGRVVLAGELDKRHAQLQQR